MVQRRGSLSSNGSPGGSFHRPSGLQRQNSSGSMTERTFRDPSPNRGASLSLHPDDAPPVPALPRSYISPPPVPVKSTRRAASVEPPERVNSPTFKAAGRGVSLDRGPGVMQPNKRSKQRAPSLGSIGEPERGQTRDSINFSRPMSPQNSPPSSPLNERRLRSLAAPSASNSNVHVLGLQDGEADNISYAIQETANRPVKKKKKAVAKDMSEGSHFAGVNKGNKLNGTALASTPPRQPPSSSSTPSPLEPKLQIDRLDDARGVEPQRKKKRNVSLISNQDQEGAERSRSLYTSDSDTQSERSISSDRPRGYNTRAAGLLAKQPSIVREDREAEELEERIPPGDKASDSATRSVFALPVGLPQYNSSAGQPAAMLIASTPTSLGGPTAKPVFCLEPNPGSDAIAKNQSLSPARAAHFSSQPSSNTLEVVRHQPPARSVSPAKSALKHSPSPRGPSPVGSVPGAWGRRNGRPASEASDTTSLISDDGFKGAPRRKKSVRVSFDDESLVVGRAASPPTSPDSPVIMSPQNNDGSSREWYPSSREKREVGTSTSETDTAIQPIPALPTFGSVRERKVQGSFDQPISFKNDQTPQATPGRVEASSDIVIGNVLAQHHRDKNQGRFNDSIPPKITFIEGTGPRLDTGDSHSNHYSIHPPTAVDGKLPLPHVENAPNQTTASAKGSDQARPGSISNGLIPFISILPATPGVETPRTEQKGWLRIPGQFPLSTESLVEDQTSVPPIVGHHATDPTPAEIGIAEPEPEPAAANHEPGHPAVGSVADGLRTQINSHIDESEDTAESIYSDAAEDLSDIEGDGFGSINAIVESPPDIRPISLPHPQLESSKAGLTATSERPSMLGRNESELSEPASEEGWDRAQQYWSGLSQTRKQQLERAAIPGAADERPAEPKSKPRSNLKKPPQSPVLDHPPLPPWPDKQYREEIAGRASPTASAMKKSMRGSQFDPPQESHMRSSMRNGAVSLSQRNLAQPMVPPQPKGALQKKSRPISAAAIVDYNKPATKPTTDHGRASSVGVGSTAILPKSSRSTTPNLRRVKSNDSDSSSSFKRQRPTTADSNRYTMKRSMRNGTTDDPPQSLRGNRESTYSARSPLPDGSTRRPFSAAGSSMRTSMRGQASAAKQARSKSPSRFAFGKATKSKPTSRSKSGFSSRFGDSSDEDQGPINHRSRFEDSSDEDGPSGLTPVRGIPRRIDEGDSTDLDDSSAEATPVIPRAKPRSTSKAQNLQGSTLAAGSVVNASTSAPIISDVEAKVTADKEKKKRSFFGGLGGKKRDEPRVRSPTRLDSPLERPKAPRILTTDSRNLPAPGAAPSPKSPKLQRRNTPKRFLSDSWPLPEPIKADARPNTSDGNIVVITGGNGNGNGNGAMTRPDLGTRRSTVQGEAAAETNGAAVEKAGKKKRFPMLRKAFRLND